MTLVHPYLYLTGSKLSASLRRSITSPPREERRISALSTEAAPRGLEDLNIIDTTDGSTLNPSPPSRPSKEDFDRSLSSTLFPSYERWRMYFMQEVAHNRFLEAQLLMLSLATGIIDAVSIVSFRVFV